MVVRHCIRHLPRLAAIPLQGTTCAWQTHALCTAITVLSIWGLTSFIPGTVGVGDGVFGFIYLFILISAYKWYMKPFTLKQIWLMAGIGLGFFLLYTCASIVLSLFGIDVGIFITGPFKLPVIMVGFGIFLLFDRLSFHNRIINRIAQSAFAVYLITEYPATRTLLWKHLFVLKDLYQPPFAILWILGILLAIYIACILIDFVRQGLFAVTVNRNRGRWLELVWDGIEKQIKHLQEE